MKLHHYNQMMAHLTRRQKFAFGGVSSKDTVLPKPNPLSPTERNQKVFYDYVGRMKKYLGAGVDMPEWFVKDLVTKKAEELGVELKAGGGRLKAFAPLVAPYLLPYAAAFIGTTATGLMAQQKIQNYFENNPEAMPKFKEWVSAYIPGIHGPKDKETEELEKAGQIETFPKEDWSKSFGTGEGTKIPEEEKIKPPVNIPPQIKVEPETFPIEEPQKPQIFTADRIPVEGEKGIAQVGKRFEVRISRGGKFFEKRFDNIEQAIAFRDKIAETPSEAGKHMIGRSGELNPRFGKYKEEGGSQNIRKILTDFIAQGKTTYTTQDVLDLVDKNLLKDENTVEQTLQKIKKEKPFQDLEFVSDTGGPIEFSAEVKQSVLDNYRKLTNESMADLIFPGTNKITGKGRIKRILTELEAEGKIIKMKPGDFPTEVSDTFDTTPENIKRQIVQKERVDTIKELGSKTYEDELFKFKQKVQNALGLEKIQTKGKQKIDPIDTGHRSSIKQLKELNEKITPADIGPDFYKANRLGIKKYKEGVKTLEGILKRDFYPDQTRIFKKAKKFLDEGKTIPVETRKEIVAINDKILKVVDKANLKGRINAITLDPFTLKVKRGEDVARTVGFGLTETAFEDVEIGSEDDTTNKLMYAQQILTEAVNAGLIDEKEGKAKLDKFLNSRIVKKREDRYMASTRNKSQVYPKTWLLPPEAGPTPQGLNINYNTVKTVKLEKINGRQNRQSSTKRAT